MKYAVYIVLLLSIMSCSTTQFSRYDCGFIKDSEGRAIYRGEPYDVYIDNSIPESWVPAIKSAADTWNGVIGQDMIRIIEGRIDTAGLGPFDSYIKMDSEGLLMPYEQGVCHNYWDQYTLLLKSVILINPHMNYSTDGTPAFNTVDVESLMLHELGHSLGLDHYTYSSKYVMGSILNQGQSRRALTESDIKRIVCMYGR